MYFTEAVTKTPNKTKTLVKSLWSCTISSFISIQYSANFVTSTFHGEIVKSDFWIRFIIYVLFLWINNIKMLVLGPVSYPWPDSLFTPWSWQSLTGVMSYRRRLKSTWNPKAETFSIVIVLVQLLSPPHRDLIEQITILVKSQLSQRPHRPFQLCRTIRAYHCFLLYFLNCNLIS